MTYAINFTLYSSKDLYTVGTGISRVEINLLLNLFFSSSLSSHISQGYHITITLLKVERCTKYMLVPIGNTGKAFSRFIIRMRVLSKCLFHMNAAVDGKQETAYLIDS